MEVWRLSLSKPPAITKKTGHAKLLPAGRLVVSASAKELPNQVRDVKKTGHAELVSASAKEFPNQVRDVKKTGHAELVSASAKEFPNQVRDVKENSHFDKLNEHKIKMKIPTDLIPV